MHTHRHSLSPALIVIGMAFVVALSTQLSGCSSIFPGVYKIDIQQGNQLKDESVDQLRTGMSQRQVVYLLGSPTLQDPFHPNRWDYVYHLKDGDDAIKSRHVKIEFKEGYVSNIEKGDWKSES